jgi:hypothetical protein
VATQMVASRLVLSSIELVNSTEMREMGASKLYY